MVSAGIQTVEVAVVKRSAVWAEDASRRDEPVEMLAEVRRHVVREGDDTTASTRFGRPERVTTAGRIVGLMRNADSAGARPRRQSWFRRCRRPGPDQSAANLCTGEERRAFRE